MRSSHRSKKSSFNLINPNAAGIDIGSQFHVVAVSLNRDPEPVRSFTSFTGDLYRLADWLEAVGITSIVMESTGIVLAFDCHTLKGSLKQMKRLVGWEAGSAYCDKGYRGNPKQLGSTIVHLSNQRKKSINPSEWRWFKRQSAIEPVIGHMKTDNRMDRNYLKGTDGDKINIILVAYGFNLRNLLRTGTA